MDGVKILLVGSTGTVGTGVLAALTEHGHDVIEASRHGEHRVDLTDPDSIGALYASVGTVDAVACAAGGVPFKPFADLSTDDYRAGFADKLLGQIELVRQGVEHVRDGGSFTLVSGVLSHDPVVTGVAASTVNGAIDAFVRAAAIELPRGIRINAMSGEVFQEAWDAYGPTFPGHRAAPVADAGRAYVKSIEGARTGEIIRVGW